MTVKSGLLAVLSLGPLYGLQLRDELTARAPHRSRLNVGQVYGTLERLTRDGLVVSAGQTTDNLPLYRPTADGEREIQRWSRDPDPLGVLEWSDMLDQVLIVSSLPEAPWRRLIDGYLERFEEPEPASLDGGACVQSRAAAAAQSMFRQAARTWLLHVRDGFDLSDPAVALSPNRPRRGRRPSPVD